MANIFDYLLWRGDLGFKQSPFNNVDNIIFSQLSYLPLDNIVEGPESEAGISIAQAAKIFAKRLKGEKSALRKQVMFKDDPALMSALGVSNRFGSCELLGFVNHVDVVQEKQFSALCIDTGDGSCFIAFRGTDTNLIGWKEDFNMSFSENVPSQIEAVNYLEKISALVKGPIRLGGHSKGGNLAIYAAAFCGKKTQNRITGIYSNDAPGFQTKVVESEGFKAIRERIHSFAPQLSVVGTFLEHGNDNSVIKSSQTGLMQHALYSWEVTHNDMVRVDNVPQTSRFVDKTLREWIAGLDFDQRQKLIDGLFTILSSTHAKSIHDLSDDWFRATGRMIQSLGNIDEPTRNIIRKTTAALFRSARNNIETLLKDQRKRNRIKQ
ncbi:MAG: DUF2974 domain-containing protein [Treponema sp.]|nr:DUF2974 domain-containing protein [Treponema sp.]